VVASTPRDRQGQAARRGAVSSRRFHRDQLEQALEERGEVLQRSWYGGAVDQRGQERRQMDKALLPNLQGQPDAIAAFRLGLQSGELPASFGPSSRCQALVADDAARETGQDRSEGNAALEVRDVPTCRSGGNAKVVLSHP